MKNKDLSDLKKEYMEVPIPKELEFTVKKAVKNSRSTRRTRASWFRKSATMAASVAVALSILTAGVNISPVLADSLGKIPIVGGLVKVLTIKTFTVNEQNYQAEIKVPKIEGLDNRKLENSLNAKYLEENKKLYDQFMADTAVLKEKGEAHLGVSTDYEVKTDNDIIFSIGRYTLTTAGSSYTEIRYDTIDKKRQVLMTLPSLFNDQTYVEVISENILNQMREQIKNQEKIYWIDELSEDNPSEAFKQIDKEQNFYINPEGKLVISFDKYEVAPGYMGNPEFVIPTAMISDLLVGQDYLK